MIKRITLLASILIISSSSLLAQTEFDKWRQQQSEEYQEYKNKFDEAFVKMLEKTWSEFEVAAGASPYEESKPNTVPSFEKPPKPKLKNDYPDPELIGDDVDLGEPIEIDFGDIPLPEKPSKKEENVDLDPSGADLFGGIPTMVLPINYFSENIKLYYPRALIKDLQSLDLEGRKLKSKDIAKFWKTISRYNHEELINYSLGIKEKRMLNDWGYVLLINDISEEISGSSLQLKRLINWFLLTKAGYEVKVGYDDNGIYNLFTVSNNIFNTQYFALDGEKFFPINFNDEFQRPGSIYTYEGKHGEQVRKLDLTLDKFPVIYRDDTFVRDISFDYGGERFDFTSTIDKGIIEYLEYYPLTDLEVFFRASLSTGSKEELYSQIIPLLEGKTELEAVNFLLALVQKSFEYKTDQDQFDREKYMTSNEILYYPYSDCDDRSIFFATLVRDILGLEVVGLKYSRHLAVAVEFSSDVNGDYHMQNGKKYTVADPTFINAPVGLTMPNYKNEKPEIIKI